jgi:hypothetical protein
VSIQIKVRATSETVVGDAEILTGVSVVVHVEENKKGRRPRVKNVTLKL